MSEKFQIYCDFQQGQNQPLTAATNKSAPSGPVTSKQQAQQFGNDHMGNSTTIVSSATATIMGQSANSNSNEIQQHNSIQVSSKVLAAIHHSTTQRTLQPLAPLQPAKREPLGLRQTSEQQAALAAASNQDEHSSQSASQSSQQSTSSVHPLRPHITIRTDEDQENDISMASLGSDFVPSIMHDSDNYNDQSFGLEGDESFVSSESILPISENGDSSGFTVGEENDDYLIEDTDMLDDSDMQDDYDEELKMELSQAFKRHDDSQLFKAVAYINDIDAYMKHLERVPEFRPYPNYLDFQDDIDSEKRSTLNSWLVEVSEEYQLQTETLFISINLIDRFLSKMSVTTSKLQLLGVAAMYIASKYEEIYPPHLHKFVEITDETFSGQQIRQMEQVILKTLKFRISQPTITFFLRQIFAYNKFPKKVYHLAEYLCYLTLIVDQPFLEYLPSEIAVASVILAAHQLEAVDNISDELKNAYDQSNLDQLARRQLPPGLSLRDIDRRKYTINRDLPFCIESLITLQEQAYKRSPNLPKELSIIDIFSREERNRVSLLPPPKGRVKLQ